MSPTPTGVGSSAFWSSRYRRMSHCRARPRPRLRRWRRELVFVGAGKPALAEHCPPGDCAITCRRGRRLPVEAGARKRWRRGAFFLRRRGRPTAVARRALPRRIDRRAVSGFCRVIWNAHVREMTDLSAANRGHLMHIVYAVESALRARLTPAKMNLASLGNALPHLHWHVVPRFADDTHFRSRCGGRGSATRRRTRCRRISSRRSPAISPRCSGAPLAE